jgi:hypothetical protein
MSLALSGVLVASGRRVACPYERWGCTMGIQFPVVKLLDYAERGDELSRAPTLLPRLCWPT